MTSSTDDNHREESISKSQRKRDMHALQDLGEQLTKLSASELKKLKLPEDLLSAIQAAHDISSRGGHKRQLQLIGKLMRNIDPEPIRHALNTMKQQSSASTKHFHMLESWRDRLINEGDNALAELLTNHPDADSQQLRQLVRNAKKEKEKNSTPKAARAIFQYLRDLLSEDEPN